LRVALYSHDTMGLGHMRRNLLIAQALAQSPLQPNILMIAGAYEAKAFAIPRGVDCLSLPALRKEPDGGYQSRSLDLPLDEVVAVRAAAIRAALQAFSPDVLIVDNVPRGAIRELDPALQHLRDRGATRCVLGLRDVLDEPEAVRREWSQGTNEDAIRDYYDAVWIYGDRAVFDPVREYRLSDHVADKVRYTGYFDRRARFEGAASEATYSALADFGLPPGRLILCMAGGGQDGARLTEALSQADLPPETNGVILTGPYMPAEVRRTLRDRAARNPRLKVLEFVPEPRLLVGCADRAIAMGGYNTVSEILSFGKSALIVPRVSPRREQLIRAERLRNLGLVDVLHPEKLTSSALSEWLADDNRRVPLAREMIDFNGLSRLPALLEETLSMQFGSRRSRAELACEGKI
jgi:predicted glycosyltransferase